MAKFDTSKNVAQATIVDPVKVNDFPFEAYLEYEGELTKRCEAFMKAKSGALVYRRMRVAEVFSYGCSDMKQSLEWQLGALKKSIEFKADVPNFLEPWYGIGVLACSFGIDYIWNVLAELEIEFYKAQEKLIGNCLVKPGHGFASSRVFEGFGMSDDNVVMIDEPSYLDFVAPSFEKLGMAFGGPVHHSCGNFSDKAKMLLKLKGLKMADAAFTPETDPHPNPAEPFVSALSNSGIVLNARMVGNQEVVKETTGKLWKPGMKLLVVTFSQSPEEQNEAFNIVHEICK